MEYSTCSPKIRRPSLIAALILLSIQRSLALPSIHPLHSTVDWLNESGPFIGLVMAYPTEAEALQNSADFVARSDLPHVDLYGITVQTLVNVFNVWGIVHYGTAGSANNSMSFGDVSVPKLVAFTGSWTWTKFGSERDEESPQLSFGTYNVPNGGENLLSGIKFKPEEFYSVGKPMQELFWMQVDPKWLKVAEQLKVELERCSNETYCLPVTPKIVSGLKASTADVFLDNAAYRQFLYNKFGVSTVDEESAAIVMTAASPGIPVIVFRGVSDLAGEEKWTSTSTLMDLASRNSLNCALEFVRVIGKRKPSVFR